MAEEENDRHQELINRLDKIDKLLKNQELRHLEGELILRKERLDREHDFRVILLKLREDHLDLIKKKFNY